MNGFSYKKTPNVRRRKKKKKKEEEEERFPFATSSLRCNVYYFSYIKKKKKKKSIAQRLPFF